MPIPGISPDSYFCELEDIPFLNRQQSEFCTDFEGYFAGGEEGARERQRD